MTSEYSWHHKHFEEEKYMYVHMNIRSSSRTDMKFIKSTPLT